jgi:hypothetical protein
MSQLIVRRTASRSDSLLGPALVGLALGATVGFMVGELFGPRAERHLVAPSSDAAHSPRRTMAELVAAALTALSEDRELSRLSLEVIPVSRQVVELHGWVPTRLLRTRALRVAAAAVGAQSVVNRLLVRGEDDAAHPDLGVLSA